MATLSAVSFLVSAAAVYPNGSPVLETNELLISSDLSPKRECGSQRFKSAHTKKLVEL